MFPLLEYFMSHLLFTPPSRHFGGIGARKQRIKHLLSLQHFQVQMAVGIVRSRAPFLSCPVSPARQLPANGCLQTAVLFFSTCACQTAVPGLSGKRMCTEM